MEIGKIRSSRVEKMDFLFVCRLCHIGVTSFHTMSWRCVERTKRIEVQLFLFTTQHKRKIGCKHSSRISELIKATFLLYIFHKYVKRRDLYSSDTRTKAKACDPNPQLMSTTCLPLDDMLSTLAGRGCFPVLFSRPSIFELASPKV